MLQHEVIILVISEGSLHCVTHIVLSGVSTAPTALQTPSRKTTQLAILCREGEGQGRGGAGEGRGREGEGQGKGRLGIHQCAQDHNCLN